MLPTGACQLSKVKEKLSKDKRVETAQAVQHRLAACYEIGGLRAFTSHTYHQSLITPTSSSRLATGGPASGEIIVRITWISGKSSFTPEANRH